MSTFTWSNIIPETIKEMTPMMKGLVSSYMEKDENTDTVTWMGTELAKHIGIPAEEAMQMSQEFSATIGRFSENLNAIQESCATGNTREEWLRNTLAKNAEGKNTQEYANYLEQVNENLTAGNAVVRKAMQSPGTFINLSEEALAEEDELNDVEWNRYKLQNLSASIANQAELAGMNGMSVPVDSTIISSMEDMTGSLPTEIIEGTASDALDSGVKMAAAAALKVVAETKKIPFLSKLLPIMGIANLACWAVEGAKCLGRCALGGMSAMQGIEQMKRASVAVMADLITSGLAPRLFAAIPVVGMPLSFAASLILPNMTTHEVREKLYIGVTIICETAKTIAHSIVEQVTGVFTSVKNTVSAIFA